MNYKIPLFKLNFDEAETHSVVKTLENQWLSMGPQCVEFEDTFAQMSGAKRGVSIANCTAALHLALMALDVKEGDEVIVPSLTFVATANCVRYVGATPVFADITSLEDLTISVADIKRKITPKTKAVIPMHFAGYGANMEAIMSIAKEHDLKVIEDACHGPLSEYHGKKLGSIGDVGCFSFFSNKNISTGEGGMLITNSDEIADKIKLLRSHGMTTMSYQRATGHATTYDVVSNGFNYRMDDLRAGIGLAQLKKLPADLEKRSQVRKWYLEALEGIEGITIPFEDRHEFSSNYVMPIVLDNADDTRRDSIRERLHSCGIQTSVHYPAAHRFSVFQEYVAGELPLTEYVTDAELTLPMYAALSKEEVSYIAESLKKAVSE
ncbi:DegT/DnrJ/EryC1/StrS family aminotransferase [Pseudoalteromonas sp. NEC-BIFX-2020_002]|uniref:DegT/DnrJ/EryC1/StrS family aminotransferase n=1 Tax=Pseudoalteromonas sp. NEC-BIFX-2020_002 TaxID=2732353 RepID=UPI00147690AD|nr:DegT/DnrJ/EryC1/StrS family aminotransferase [Pseudoalteromonas sp. NEC-BIFX-2020_002]NNG45149.1 DegT/DnrJ/EryC1/StrS family aminotransferase [Pseudoalteromonas sp. NEC-BIFX-2020_002]